MSRLIKAMLDQYYYGEACLQRLMRTGFPFGPFPEIALVTHNSPLYQNTSPESSVESILEKGFLWTAPRNRRSRERRQTKKFGSPTGHNKMLPVLKLLNCLTCGHAYEPSRLCPNCYKLNKELTREIQDAMHATQGIDPIEHEVLPQFHGQEFGTSGEYFEGKRIVKVPRELPKWFSRTLTQKSNVTTSEIGTVTEVKPVS